MRTKRANLDQKIVFKLALCLQISWGVGKVGIFTVSFLLLSAVLNVRAEYTETGGGLCSQTARALGISRGPLIREFRHITGDYDTAFTIEKRSEIESLINIRAKTQRQPSETLDRIRVLALIGNFYAHTKDPDFRSTYEAFLNVARDDLARRERPEVHTTAMDSFIDDLLYSMTMWKPVTIIRSSTADGPALEIHEKTHPLRLAFGDKMDERVDVILDYLRHRRPAVPAKP